jgi:hypothetical protein
MKMFWGGNAYSSTLKTDAAGSSETLVTFYKATWHRIPENCNLCKTLLAACFILVSFFAYSLTLKMEATCSSKMLFAFHWLHSIVSQKTEFFIVTAVRTWSDRHFMLHTFYQEEEMDIHIQLTSWQELTISYLDVITKSKDLQLLQNNLICIKCAAQHPLIFPPWLSYYEASSNLLCSPTGTFVLSESIFIRSILCTCVCICTWSQTGNKIS